MNSIERVMTTLAHQQPDRVPVDLHNFMMTPRYIGSEGGPDFYRSGEALAEGQIAAWKRFGHDVLLDIGRHDIVVAELHRITALPACHAGQRSRVGCDFSEWGLGMHRL